MPRGNRRKMSSFYADQDLLDEVRHAAHAEGVSQNTIIRRALTQYFTTKIQRSSWVTDSDNSNYDEKKFYTRSQDKNGHSLYLRLWIDKGLAGVIGKVVNSGEIPEYRSSQDFYRDAIYHRAYRVAQWIDNAELEAEAGLAMMLAEEDKIAQAKKDIDLLIENTRENLQTAWDRGEYDWIEQTVNDRLERATHIPEKYQLDYVRMLTIFKDRVGEARRGRVKHIGRTQRPETANN